MAGCLQGVGPSLLQPGTFTCIVAPDTGSCYQLETMVSAWGTGMPASGRFTGNITSTVTVGTACPVVATNVVMTPTEYKTLIDSAAVVTKLDGTEGILVVAVIVLCLVAGLFFGWKAVGRGAGRSG